MKEILQKALFGFVIGDCLGGPVEGKTREDLKQNPVVGLLEKEGNNKKIGVWSDDTSMVLATMQSIINKKQLDYCDLMNEFMKWYQEGKYTPYGEAFDIGNTTRKALEKYSHLKGKPFDCGEKGEKDNGNGSLMRMLPIAFYCLANRLTDNQIYEVASKSSSLTHGNQKSIFSCYLYIIFMLELIKNRQEEKEAIYANFKLFIHERKHYDEKEFDGILKEDIREKKNKK